MSVLQAAYNELALANSRLRAELAAAQLERDTALTDRFDTIQELRAENETLRGQNTAVVAELAKLADDNETLRKRVMWIEGERDRTRNALGDALKYANDNFSILLTRAEHAIAERDAAVTALVGAEIALARDEDISAAVRIITNARAALNPSTAGEKT